jgi:cell division septation protein DedD
LDEQKGLGQYVDKAADYLHHYHHPTTTTAADHPPTSKPDHHKSEEDAAAGKSEHGHGIGDFAKTAGGFFK